MCFIFGSGKIFAWGKRGFTVEVNSAILIMILKGEQIMARSKEAMQRAKNKHNREHTTQVMVRLNCKTDADVIERFNSISESKLGYVKRLIREDIAKGVAANE